MIMNAAFLVEREKTKSSTTNLRDRKKYRTNCPSCIRAVASI